MNNEGGPLLPLSLFLVTVITRFPFMSRFLYHMDSVHFALALDNYNITVHQPHPPGYFLYVLLGRLLHLFVGDANTVFVSISIFCSGAAVVAVYFLGKELHDLKTGVLAAAVALVSPNLWFHGEVALTYIVEALFSAATAFFCWKVYKGENKYLWLSAFVLGLAGGIRQNTVAFLLPLWLLSVRRLPAKKVAQAVFLLSFVCLLWFVPMVWMTGGWTVYRDAFYELWQFNTGHNSVFERGWPMLKLFSSTLFDFTMYGIGAGIFPLCLAAYSIIRRKRLHALDRDRILFFSFWVLPSFFFYLLIFIHPANPGYVLIFLPALFILIAESVIYISSELREFLKTDLTAVIASIVIVANVFFFFSFRSLVSYGEIRNHEHYLSLIINGFKAFNPATTIIIAEPYVYFGFRQIMYYLPDYRVYQIDIKVTPDGKMRKTWWGMHRQTFLTEEIEVPRGVDTFAMPLVADDVNKVRGLRGINVRSFPGTNMYIAYGNVSLIGKIYPRLRISSQTG
jgi:uncharacterized membrane protein